MEVDFKILKYIFIGNVIETDVSFI